MSFNINMTAGYTFIFVIVYIIIIFTFYPTKLIYEDQASVPDDHLHQINDLITTTSQDIDDESLMMVRKEERLMDFLNGSLALVNINAKEWPKSLHDIQTVKFDRISKNITWKDLFPEWIDEDIQHTEPKCPVIPMPTFTSSQVVYSSVDIVVAELPCTYVKGKFFNKDLFRLQVHLVAANVALRMGRRDKDEKLTIVFRGECKPMMEMFRCDDMVQREGPWWVYRVDARSLKEKLSMPVGSCKLAINLNNVDKALQPRRDGKREAYASVIHSSSRYVCGAIILAQALLHTRTYRELLLLHDDSIPSDELKGLLLAGWKLRLVSRIRNPHVDKDKYNAYNYTKLRLWLMIEYSKIVFLDADVLVLRNIDFMFRLPQLSARGNDGDLFNSGVMVIEPSECSFQTMMDRQMEIVSYNGGDQGFLNEIFVWWHRMPCKVNFMKTFNSKSKQVRQRMEHLLTSKPPEFYAIHYLGMKPWTCYRDYDCNWNNKRQNVFANDVAHRLWWISYDRIDSKLCRFCNLTDGRKQTLRQNLRNATQENFQDQHWKIPIFDPRFL
ncbi:UDP-glucuronate:xylan alpha-glucuronosyltransferase 2 [Zostera marina]|uniref:Hexosyltransferase n=1 Tax=Zostera marina TaxID=29655 RepID=A0A0K9NLW6_ZOSMR|nr:UDP-glucuronate:xylan alpha-glucuronosyltransferase 2 [Zostera marina]